MKAVDVGRKVFHLCSTSEGGTSDVVDISFVQGWFCSRVLFKDLFLDMPHEQTRIIRSQTSPHCDPSYLPIKISIERECVQSKDQFCKTNQSTGWWLQDLSFVEKMRQCQEAIAIGDDSVQRFHTHSENIVESSRKAKRVRNTKYVICIWSLVSSGPGEW